MRGGIIVALVGASFLANAALAQTRTIDPNSAGAMAATRPDGTIRPADAPLPDPAPMRDTAPEQRTPASPPPMATYPDAPPPPATTREQARAAAANTYQRQDVLTAAEGVFGKGAAGLAGLIEKIFREQGEPTAYIAGREAGGAFMVGVRYGSGTLYHKVEGQRPVNWTGPSIGFDVGANGAKSFVLVYNLYDTQDLFHRFPAAQGNVYVVGGFTASYLRRGHIVVIPIQLGLGARLGANVGYMRFTEKPHWVPL